MKKRILFLDFDGVVNSHKFIMTYVNHFKQPDDKTYVISEHIDPVCVERVNRIIAALNADVVISSAWRKAFPLQKLEEMLESKGFVGQIIGETPIMNVDRGLEIQAWMDANNVSADQILILDDMDAMLHLKPRQVLTSFFTGLLERHVEEALSLFEGVN